MNKINAVVKLSERTQRSYNYSSNHVSLVFSAAYTDKDGQRVNQEWAEATPAFNLNMTVKADVAEQFEFDKEYLLAFEERA